MENVLSGIVILFLILFAVFTLSADWAESQVTIAESVQEMQRRLQERAATSIRVIDHTITANGVQIMIENSGSRDLLDFGAWDVVVAYFDDATPANYWIEWLGHEAVGAGWDVQGIYIDAASVLEERFSPDILNPSEQATLDIELAHAFGEGTTLQATIITANGIGTSTQIHRNDPPELISNTGITITALGTGDILNTALLVDDSDHPADQRMYTVTIAPTQGALSLGDTFSQADIDSGLLNYTHTGAGSDQFTFMVSDGEDTIGSYVFVITVNP